MIPDLEIWHCSNGSREIHFYPAGKRDHYLIGFSLDDYTIKRIVTILNEDGMEVTEEMILEVLNKQ